MGFFGSKKNKEASDNNSEKELSQILVKEIMAKELIIAPQSTTIYQISKMMEQGIGSVFVKKDASEFGRFRAGLESVISSIMNRSS